MQVIFFFFFFFFFDGTIVFGWMGWEDFYSLGFQCNLTFLYFILQKKKK